MKETWSKKSRDTVSLRGDQMSLPCMGGSYKNFASFTWRSVKTFPNAISFKFYGKKEFFVLNRNHSFIMYIACLLIFSPQLIRQAIVFLYYICEFFSYTRINHWHCEQINGHKHLTKDQRFQSHNFLTNARVATGQSNCRYHWHWQWSRIHERTISLRSPYTLFTLQTTFAQGCGGE